MLTWLARLPALAVLPEDGLEADVREVIRQLRNVGCAPHLYLLRSGVRVPVVACVGFGDGRKWPGATVSLAAHLVPGVAARKAVLEQAHVGTYIRRLMLSQEHPVPDGPEEIRTLADHALYYVSPDRQSAFSFLAGSETAILSIRQLARPAEVSLRECARRVEEAGLQVALVDVTSPDLLDTPFRVVRAVGADIQPIHFGSGMERLGNRRLHLALAGSPPNPEPHPLA